MKARLAGDPAFIKPRLASQRWIAPPLLICLNKDARERHKQRVTFS
jgi:hypothetical protein